MIKAEFGIINDFNEKKDYTGYYPEKYHCVAIDDDLYMFKVMYDGVEDEMRIMIPALD